ncbi:MAG: phosphate propanoyltransferase [Erysipelotrichaceae bacterium]|nr:phosphate propanoyltransferase [Erysipelotrichaceae bacterium]
MSQDTFLVETSARHVHVTQEHLEKLFGEGYQLTVRKMLSQPGQFASNEKVTVVGPKGELKCSILGPVRKDTQIEVSLTEARQLGIKAPVRESGDIAGSAGCKLIGPAGEVEVSEGVIAAMRHVHMTPEDAEHYGVENGQIVAVKVFNGVDDSRALVFENTVVRVSKSYSLAMHIDTDESNAAGAPNQGFIVG